MSGLTEPGAVCSQVYLYDCRLGDEALCCHHLHHGLGHHGPLHARHVEAVHVIPESDAVSVLLRVSDGRQADVAQVWIHCGEERGVKGWCRHVITAAASRPDARGEPDKGWFLHPQRGGHRSTGHSSPRQSTGPVWCRVTGTAVCVSPGELTPPPLVFYTTSRRSSSAFSSCLVTVEFIPSGYLFARNKRSFITTKGRDG